MFEIGFWELLLVLAIALVILGPQRLSQFAYSLGQWIGQLKSAIQDTQKKPDAAPPSLTADEHKHDDRS